MYHVTGVILIFRGYPMFQDFSIESLAAYPQKAGGLGLVPANFDPKTGTVSYQVPQKLRDKTCTVIVSAKSEGKKVETHWTFGIEEAAATAASSPAAAAKK